MTWFLLQVTFGLILLTWGADRFVIGSATLAKKIGVTPLLIGLTIVALGTSAPEILVSAFSAFQGETDLAIGNAIGSNIFNIGLVLGVVLLIQPIKLSSAIISREMSILLAVTLLIILVFLDAYLSRIDGFMLLGALVIVIFWLIRTASKSTNNDANTDEYNQEFPDNGRPQKIFLWLIIGLIALLIGADLLVEGAINIAESLGMSEIVIGIVLVAFGTSLPELAVSIVSAIKGEHGMALGNIIGSNIFNSLAVVSVAAIIQPAPLLPSVMSLHILVMVIFTLALFAITYEFKDNQIIGRREGFILLLGLIFYEVHIVLSSFLG